MFKIKKLSQADEDIDKPREKKLNKFYERAFIVSLIAFVIYFGWIEPKIIGHDTRYALFIIALPTLLGVVLMEIHRRKYLSFFLGSEHIFGKIILGGMLLVFATMFSYTSFGLVTNICWHIIDESVSKSNKEEIVLCQVTKFVNARHNSRNHFSRDHVFFKFNNRTERINMASLNEYSHEDPANYLMQLTIQKGIWDLYTVKESKLIEKQ